MRYYRAVQYWTKTKRYHRAALRGQDIEAIIIHLPADGDEVEYIARYCQYYNDSCRHNVILIEYLPGIAVCMRAVR